MSEARYTIAEIDCMRQQVERLHGLNQEALNEERLRTYMANGTTPAELERAADAFDARRADCMAIDYLTRHPNAIRVELNGVTYDRSFLSGRKL